MSIQVRIAEEGALRNQRFAFTDKFNLVSELLQNARRAGAHNIDVTYDDTLAILRVRDDGCGIRDFQKLLTFHESGWDASTCGLEHPYGIGFSACLYAASRCIVSSYGRQIDFSTTAALAREPIDVIDIPSHPCTLIELYDVRLLGLAQRLPWLVDGFPIPIRFNGEVLPRPYALGALPFQAAAIGWVHLAGIENSSCTRSTLAYLQGHCVLRPGFCYERDVNIVHLDPRQFVARFPDRSQLIDAEDQSRRIESCLAERWRQVLLDQRSALDSRLFLERYFHAICAWGHADMLNDVDLLPRPVCEQFVGYPVQQVYNTCECLAPVEHPVARHEIENGSVTVVTLDQIHEDNAACWMFAKAMDYRVLAPGYLPVNHWVHPHVRALDEQRIRVVAIGEQGRTRLEGRWIWPEVVLCEAVHLTHGDDGVLVRDEGVFHEDTLFIPRGEQSGNPVRQASDYVDSNDQFLESDRDDDCAALADLIMRMRSADPDATLASLLNELTLEKYPVLQGKTFLLTIGENPEQHRLTVVPDPSSLTIGGRDE